jgi:hypothetical protein
VNVLLLFDRSPNLMGKGRFGRDDFTMTHEGAPAVSLRSCARTGAKAKQPGGTMLLPNQLWLFDLAARDEAAAPEEEKAAKKRQRRAPRSASKSVQLSLFVSATA